MKMLFVLLLLIAGCTTAQPQATIRVNVPVPVPCVIPPFDMPDFAVDDLSPDTGIWDMMSALRADRIQRKAYESILQAAINACR